MSIKIKSFNQYNEQVVLDYINYSINESVDIKSILHKTLLKIKNFSTESKKRIIEHLIVGLLAVYSPVIVHKVILDSSADPQTKSIAISTLDEKEKTGTDSTNWKNGFEFTLSQNGWNHIKDEEKLKLRAYSIGDGMITVGYGHAEPEFSSNYKVGDKISENEARKLLKSDLTIAADGVRKIFREWNKNGKDVKITQEMFDALVSIAFNCGISNLRTSELIQDIKREDFVEAGKKIKTFNLSKRFPGLEQRREKESEMFLASL